MTHLANMKISSPTVSIIVTTFNRVNFLSETIDSILGQTYTNFELIIIDNMSEDGTVDYINNLSDPRVHYYRNENHGVIAVNRNFGIELAKGKYIALCDDDDLWLPEKLSRQVTLMSNQPNVALCYTNAESFSDDQIIKRKMIRRRVRDNYFNQLLQGSYIPNSSVLIRVNIFEDLGLLTEDPMLREDYHMWLRIAKNYDLKGIDESLIRYRVHISNVAGNRAFETLKSIYTVKQVTDQMKVAYFLVFFNVAVQYLKYIYYRVF